MRSSHKKHALSPHWSKGRCGDPFFVSLSKGHKYSPVCVPLACIQGIGIAGRFQGGKALRCPRNFPRRKNDRDLFAVYIRSLFAFQQDLQKVQILTHDLHARQTEFFHIASNETISFLYHRIKESNIFTAAPKRFSSARENIGVKILSVFW